MSGQILWGVMPYIVLTIFIGGHIYRYQHDQFGWTAKSSELLERKNLRRADTFHWGMVCVIGGHLMGILIPEALYSSIGISEHVYHKMAIGAGLPAGIVACTGLIILTYRRLFDKRIRKTSSPSDILTLLLLLFMMLSGVAPRFSTLIRKDLITGQL